MFFLGISLMILGVSGCTIYSESSLPDLHPHTGKAILLLQGVQPSGIRYELWNDLGLEVEKEAS